MQDFQFSFDVDSFNDIFPFYILIEKDLTIKSIGKSLKKILPQLQVETLFTSSFSIQRPQIEDLSANNFNETIGQLIVFNSLSDNSISIRGQINIHNDYYLFIGTPWFASMENVIEKKLTLHDFAIFDPLLDLLHVLKNQEINNSELKELLNTINTQRKILKKDKEELNKLSLVASANKNGVVFTYPDGKIFWCNDSYLDLTGFTREEVVGKTPVEIGLCELSSKEELAKMRKAFNERKVFDVEIYHAHKTKKPFWSKTIGQPVFDKEGNLTQYFAIIEDNSIEKEYEEHLSILSSIAEKNLNAVIICDKAGNIEWVNDSFVRLSGYSKEEAIGIRPGKLLQGPETDTDSIIYLANQIKKGLPFNCEIINYTKNKEKYWIKIQGQALKNSNGEVVKYFAIEEDITLLKTYKERIDSERQKYSNIIANMNMGLLEVDTTDTVLFANQSFCDMSGYSLLDLLGNKASDLLMDEKEQKVIKSKNSARTEGVSDSYEITTKTKKGESRHWLISGAPNYNLKGELIGSIGIHLDITEQKTLEIQKEQLLKRLEKQNEQLNEYAQIVSHDLKSPLRSIHSLISWIKEDNDKEFSPETTKYLNLIEGKIEKMDHLIQGILTYSKVDLEETHDEDIDINEVVNSCINIIHIPENIHVTIENKLPTIRADKFRMQQIFQNIISNAVNYSDKPLGLVTVGCQEEETNYVFYVKDNGPGIAKENQEKIFKIFQSFTQHESSTGIGLSIVKRIIDNYNGSISVESELTKGTTFFIKLPKSNL